MIKIGVVFGGDSDEHEVSLASAGAVLNAIDALPGYEAYRLGIDKDGNWVFGEGAWRFLVSRADPDMLFIDIPEDVPEKDIINIPPHEHIAKCDFILPLTHGAVGEDGRLQGFFETLGKTIIGCETLSSAVCFDKTYLKKLLDGHGFKVVPGEVVDMQSDDISEKRYEEICKSTEATKFAIKPNDSGSGIGVSIAHNYEEFKAGLEMAAQYTQFVLVEKFIQHKEIVVGVVGNGDDLVISHLGESNAEVDNVYKYEDKYNENTFCKAPADIPDNLTAKIIEQTAEIYNLVGCKDWARIDFFIENETNEIYMNEINTIPGFSAHSVFPKIFESKGIGYKDLIKLIIQSAEKVERQREESEGEQQRYQDQAAAA